MGLIALRHVGSSWTRPTPVSCIGRWILIHCTTREVQLQSLEGMFLSGVVYIFLKKRKKKKTVSQQVKFLRPMCMCVGVAMDVGVGVGVCLCLYVCVGEESQRRESRTQTPRTISL